MSTRSLRSSSPLKTPRKESKTSQHTNEPASTPQQPQITTIDELFGHILLFLQKRAIVFDAWFCWFFAWPWKIIKALLTLVVHSAFAEFVQSFLVNLLKSIALHWRSLVQHVSTGIYWIFTRIVWNIEQGYLLLLKHILKYLLYVITFAALTTAAKAGQNWIEDPESEFDKTGLLYLVLSWLFYYGYDFCYGVSCALILPPALPIIAVWFLVRQYLAFVQIGEWWLNLAKSFAIRMLGAGFQTFYDIVTGVWNAGEKITMFFMLPVAKGIFHLVCFSIYSVLASITAVMGTIVAMIGAIWGVISNVGAVIFSPFADIGAWFGEIPEKMPLE